MTNKIFKQALVLSLAGTTLLSTVPVNTLNVSAAEVTEIAQEKDSKIFIPFRSYYINYLTEHSGEPSDAAVYVWCKMLAEQYSGNENAAAGKWFDTYYSAFTLPGGITVSENEAAKKPLIKDGQSNAEYDQLLANLINANGMDFLYSWLKGNVSSGEKSFIQFFDAESGDFSESSKAIAEALKTSEGSQMLAQYTYAKTGNNESTVGVTLLKLLANNWNDLNDNQKEWCKDYLPYLLVNYRDYGVNAIASESKNSTLYDFMARSMKGAQCTYASKAQSGKTLQQEFFDYVVESKEGFGTFLQNVNGGAKYVGAYSNTADLSKIDNATNMLTIEKADADIDYYTASANGGDNDYDWFNHAMYLNSVNSSSYTQFATVYKLITTNATTSKLYNDWINHFSAKTGASIPWEHRSEQTADRTGVLQYFEWMTADPNTMRTMNNVGPSGTGEWGNGGIGKVISSSNSDTFVNTTSGAPRDYTTIRLGDGYRVSSNQGKWVTYRFDRGYISGFTYATFKSGMASTARINDPYEAGPWWLSNDRYNGIWRWSQPLNAGAFDGFDQIKVTLQGTSEPYPDGHTYNSGKLIDTEVTVKIVKGDPKNGSPVASAPCKADNLGQRSCTMTIKEQDKKEKLYLVIEMPISAQQKTTLWCGALTSVKLAKVEMSWSGANKCIDGHDYKDWTVKYTDGNNKCVLSHECKNCGVEESEVLSIDNGKVTKDEKSDSTAVIYTYKPTLVDYKSWTVRDPKDLGSGSVVLTAANTNKISGTCSVTSTNAKTTVSHLRADNNMWITRTIGTFETNGTVSTLAGTIKANVKNITIKAASNASVTADYGSCVNRDIPGTLIDVNVYSKNGKLINHVVGEDIVNIDMTKSGLSNTEKEGIYIVVNYSVTANGYNQTAPMAGWSYVPSTPTGKLTSTIESITLNY